MSTGLVFADSLAGAGRIEFDTIREFAETAGVFGVPSFIVEGELFWGREHLADIREKLAPLARNNPVRATPLARKQEHRVTDAICVRGKLTAASRLL